MILDRDVFGKMLLAHQQGRSSLHFIERSDGCLDSFESGSVYFTPESGWHSIERRSVRLLRGAVLDIGCGAGRHSLVMQHRGLKVTAIDPSPSAVKVCRLRGVRDARALGIDDLGKFGRGQFNGAVMFGNNFGLMGTPSRARRYLRAFDRIMASGGKIVFGSLNVLQTANPNHRAYHRWNRRRGAPPGQIRMRVRFGRLVGPWFEYLMMSPGEVRKLVAGTRWRLTRAMTGRGPYWVGVLEREKP